MRKGFVLPELMTIDRTLLYNDIEYRIMEFLNSNMLLVVKEQDFVQNSFPLQTYIIPDNES